MNRCARRSRTCVTATGCSTLWAERRHWGARRPCGAHARRDVVRCHHVAARSSLYSSGILAVHPTAFPRSASATSRWEAPGKTPLAAYFARSAPRSVPARRQRSSCVAMARTSRSSIVRSTRTFRSSSRRIGSSGAENAKRTGCDVVVLDDAFQHRRASRVADVVLVSADGWREQRDTCCRLGRGVNA